MFVISGLIIASFRHEGTKKYEVLTKLTAWASELPILNKAQNPNDRNSKQRRVPHRGRRVFVSSISFLKIRDCCESHASYFGFSRSSYYDRDLQFQFLPVRTAPVPAAHPNNHAVNLELPLHFFIAFPTSPWHRVVSWSQGLPVQDFSIRGRARLSPIMPSAQTARFLSLRL